MKGYLVQTNSGLTLVFPETKREWFCPSNEELVKFLTGETSFADWEGPGCDIEVWENLTEDEILVDTIYGDYSCPDEAYELLAVRDDQEAISVLVEENLELTSKVLEDLELDHLIKDLKVLKSRKPSKVNR